MLTSSIFPPSITSLRTDIHRDLSLRLQNQLHLLPRLPRNEVLDPPSQKLVRLRVNVVQTSMARLEDQPVRELERRRQSWSGKGRSRRGSEMVLSLLFGDEGDEFLPSSAPVEAFLVRMVVVLVEVGGSFRRSFHVSRARGRKPL